jgi:hypothetical protein
MSSLELRVGSAPLILISVEEPGKRMLYHARAASNLPKPVHNFGLIPFVDFTLPFIALAGQQILKRMETFRKTCDLL